MGESGSDKDRDEVVVSHEQATISQNCLKMLDIAKVYPLHFPLKIFSFTNQDFR